MKKRFLSCLALEGVLCAAWVLLGQAQPNLFGTLVTFPFQQIGVGLRALSLSGSVGNVVAITLYALVSLLPVGYLALRIKNKKAHGEDTLLLILSGAMFFIIYLMINPHLQRQFIGALYASWGEEMLCTILYSFLTGWVTIKVLRKCIGAEETSLMDYLKYLLMAIAAFYVLDAFGLSLDGLAVSVSSMYEANSGSTNGLELTVAFLILQYMVNALPNVLSCGIILKVVQMLEEMKQEVWSDAVITYAEKISSACSRMLMITVMTGVSFNLLQLAFMRSLRVVNSVIQLPLTTMVLAIVLLLLARFIRSHKELKEENDYFI